MFKWIKKSAPVEAGGYSLQGLYESPSKEFFDNEIRKEASSIANDILKPYIFTDDIIGMDNSIPYKTANIRTLTTNIKDILVNAFFGSMQVISKIKLKNDFTGGTNSYLVSIPPNDKTGAITIKGTTDVEVYPDHVELFTPFLSASDVIILYRIFNILWNIYEELRRDDTLRQIPIFKMHGMRATITKPVNDEEARVIQEAVEKMRSDVSIVMKNGGIIDQKDEITVQNKNRDALDALIARRDFVYLEIARILKVPVTRLTGQSSQGLNSTGEYDYKNYELTLEQYRQNWLEPFLSHMKIPFSKTKDVNIEDLVQLHKIALENQASDEFIDRMNAGIEKIWDEKIGDVF